MSLVFEVILSLVVLLLSIRSVRTQLSLRQIIRDSEAAFKYVGGEIGKVTARINVVESVLADEEVEASNEAPQFAFEFVSNAAAKEGYDPYNHGTEWFDDQVKWY